MQLSLHRYLRTGTYDVLGVLRVLDQRIALDVGLVGEGSWTTGTLRSCGYLTTRDQESG